MESQKHNMVVLGQIVKHIPSKLIEKLKNKHKIQTRAFSETSHVVAMIFAQLSHALSLNDICYCLKFHKGYLAQIRNLKVVFFMPRGLLAVASNYAKVPFGCGVGKRRFSRF